MEKILDCVLINITFTTANKKKEKFKKTNQDVCGQ